MFEDPAGPIEFFEWGRYQINGEVHSEDGEGVGKDICVLGGEVLAWEDRVGHTLKLRMVEMVLGKGVSTLVIGIGVQGRIRVPRRTQQKIQQAGIENLIVEKTPVACAIYNQLVREGQSVALLAHGTC